MGDSSYGLLCMEIIIFCCLFKHLIEKSFIQNLFMFYGNFSNKFLFYKKTKKMFILKNQRYVGWKTNNFSSESKSSYITSSKR